MNSTTNLVLDVTYSNIMNLNRGISRFIVSSTACFFYRMKGV